MIRRVFLASSAVSLLAVLCPAAAAEDAAAAPPFARWGREALRQIHEDLWMEGRGLYAERRHFGPRRDGERRGRRGTHPAFMWGVGVQLTALAAAAKVEPENYRKQAEDYVDAIEVYWWEADGISGYDVQPGPKDSDRYYDDNAWLVLALIELFEVTDGEKHLEKAKDTFRFVMSGHDEKFGGGLYWRETPRETKNTCTNAPAIVSALRLHQLTGEDAYLGTAIELYEWTKETLQDPQDGLYWDNIKPDGGIDPRKFTYNSAVMIRANCLLHEITGEQRYLEEARRISGSAEKHWVRENGGIADGGQFAHMLIEALAAMHAADGDKRWLDLAKNAVVFLHEEVRDPNGRYGHRWDRPQDEPLNHVMLLHQASAARAFWFAADRFAGRKPAAD